MCADVGLSERYQCYLEVAGEMSPSLADPLRAKAQMAGEPGFADLLLSDPHAVIVARVHTAANTLKLRNITH